MVSCPLRLDIAQMSITQELNIVEMSRSEGLDISVMFDFLGLNSMNSNVLFFIIYLFFNFSSIYITIFHDFSLLNHTYVLLNCFSTIFTSIFI